MPSANFAPYTGPLNPISMPWVRCRNFLDTAYSPANGAPVVQNMVPANASQISDNQLVQFDVVSPVGRGFRRIRIDVQYPQLGMWDVIYDGANVASNYFCTVTPITNGFRFSGIIRRGGWPSTQVLIFPDAIDVGGLRNA